MCSGNMQGQQMPQGIHRQMHLAPAFGFRPVIPGAAPTLQRGRQGAAIKDSRRGLGLAAFRQSEQNPQVLDDCLEDACLQPALRLLIDRLPRGQIIGHQPLRSTCAHQPAQPIEHFEQTVHALRGRFGHQGHIGGHEDPFVITDIARVRFPFHTPSVS